MHYQVYFVSTALSSPNVDLCSTFSNSDVDKTHFHELISWLSTFPLILSMRVRNKKSAFACNLQVDLK